MRLFAAALLTLSTALAAPPPDAITVEQWPAADALFHQDPRWRGADDAYSVPLGNGRILWLFADTFISETPPHSRRHGRMIHSSVGLQTGVDPTRASMQSFWRRENGQPASFFAERGDAWFWPGDGVRVGRTLLVFLMKVRAIPTGLKFEVFDWSAVAIDNPDDVPSRWHVRWLKTPPNAFRAIIGSGQVLCADGFVYAFGSHEDTPGHAICLVRWAAADAERGNLLNPEWWDSQQKTWIAQTALRDRPAPVMTDAQTEFTVHREPRVDGWLAVQVKGFTGSTVACRIAPRLTGPWPAPTTVFQPPEAVLPGVMVYAVKAHPELAADGLAVTYATNGDWERVLDDESLYYPRFLRLRFPNAPTP